MITKVETTDDGATLFHRTRSGNKDVWRRGADGTWSYALTADGKFAVTNAIHVPAEVLAKLRELMEKKQ